MKKVMTFVMILTLGLILAACNAEGSDETAQVLSDVTVEVIAHEHHDDDDHDHDDDDHDDDDHDGEGGGIGDTHHFHFAVDVAGTVAQELHASSSHHFELKLTPAGGYSWAEDVTPDIHLPDLLEGSVITSYIDDHGCLVIIVQFPA